MAVDFFGYPDLSVFPTHEQARRHLGVKPDFVVAFRAPLLYHETGFCCGRRRRETL